MNTEISMNVYKNIRETVLTAKNKVCSAVNFAMVEAYWSIGKQIAEVQGKCAHTVCGIELGTLSPADAYSGSRPPRLLYEGMR